MVRGFDRDWLPLDKGEFVSGRCVTSSARIEMSSSTSKPRREIKNPKAERISEGGKKTAWFNEPTNDDGEDENDDEYDGEGDVSLR